MGLFSDTCVNSACGESVRKGAKFCPKCGSPAPKGVVACQKCGKEVKTAAKFCWNCGVEIARNPDEARVKSNEERARLNIRLREALTQDKLDSIKNENDVEAFLVQTAHEAGLKDVLRREEIDRLKERFTTERDGRVLQEWVRNQAIADDAARAKDWKDIESREKIANETHKQKLAREQSEHEQDVKHARDGIALTAEMNRDRDEREARLLQQRSQATATALMTTLDGPAAERVARLEEFRAKQNMSPDQILALAAQASPEAAKALAAIYSADGQLSAEKARLLEKQLADQQKLADGYADRMTRVMETALGQIGGAKPGRSCPSCRVAMQPADAFCPNCGKRA